MEGYRMRGWKACHSKAWEDTDSRRRQNNDIMDITYQTQVGLRRCPGKVRGVTQV